MESYTSQKGFIPPIVGVIFLLFVVGFGTYYFGTKNSKNNQSEINQPPVSSTIPAATNYVQPSVSSSPTSQANEYEQNVTAASDLLKQIPEIKTIENAVLKAGRKPFYTPEGQNGNIITISLRESFPDDPHTSRIDTFKIDVLLKVITVEDVVNNKDITLEEWKKTIKERFL